MEKIKIYVHSFNISTLDFVDKEGAQHACAQAGSTAFSGLKHYPSSMDNRYFSDKERNALTAVENFCRKRVLNENKVEVKGFNESSHDLISRKSGSRRCHRRCLGKTCNNIAYARTGVSSKNTRSQIKFGRYSSHTSTKPSNTTIKNKRPKHFTENPINWANAKSVTLAHL
ncbi:hypothetical protein KAU88_09160 [Candidatus Bathyarchaeota archaeon]|nr:hypothetical protein [Candidatus Bathyarchaeota archaeon]